MSRYCVVEVYAGNYRNDGRQRGPKPRARCWGIGDKRTMTGHARGIVAHYVEAIGKPERALNVVVECLRWEQANARYELYT